MLLSNGAMSAASGQVREIANGMTAMMNDLGTPQGWSGADADRFQRDWNDLVHNRLMAAANKLDGISFEEIKEMLGG